MLRLYLCRVDKNTNVVIRIKWGKKHLSFEVPTLQIISTF